MPRPEKGRRPGYVLYAPWRGFSERPWFDVLFVFGVAPMANYVPQIKPISSGALLSLDAVTWARIVEALHLTPQQSRIVELILKGQCD